MKCLMNIVGEVGTADKEQKTLPRTQKKKKKMKRCSLVSESKEKIFKSRQPDKPSELDVSLSATRLEYIIHGRC